MKIIGSYKVKIYHIISIFLIELIKSIKFINRWFNQFSDGFDLKNITILQLLVHLLTQVLVIFWIKVLLIIIFNLFLHYIFTLKNSFFQKIYIEFNLGILLFKFWLSFRHFWNTKTLIQPFTLPSVRQWSGGWSSSAHKFVAKIKPTKVSQQPPPTIVLY